MDGTLTGTDTSSAYSEERTVIGGQSSTTLFPKPSRMETASCARTSKSSDHRATPRNVDRRGIGPGAIVSEAQLSSLLGCGRTPLREAVQQLKHEHLLVVPPRRGVLIPQLSIVECQQLCEAQLLVGSALMQLAAPRINRQQLNRLKDTLEQQGHCNSHADHFDLAMLDGHFHVLIAESTGNRFLIDLTSRLQSALARFLCRAYQSAGSVDSSIAEHHQIVGALERKDAGLAALRLRDHVTEGRRRALNALGLGDQEQGR